MNNEHDQYQSLTYDDDPFGDRQDTHNTDTTHTFPDVFLTLPEYPGDSLSNPDDFISNHRPDISAQMNNSFMAEFKATADQIEHQFVISNENRFVNRQGRMDEDRIDKFPDGFLTLPEYPGDSFSNPDYPIINDVFMSNQVPDMIEPYSISVARKVPTYIRNDGGMLLRLLDEVDMREDQLEERNIRQDIPANEARRRFPMDHPVRAEAYIKGSAQPTVQGEKDRITRIIRIPTFHQLSGYRIRLNNQHTNYHWLDLNIYEAMRFLRVESIPLPVLYHPSIVVRYNAFKRRLQPLSPTNGFLFDPPRITADFATAFTSFRRSPVRGVIQFYEEYTRVTGTYVDRTDAIKYLFRLLRGVRDVIPGHDVHIRTPKPTENNELGFAMILYEIYFVRGHHLEDGNIVPMIFGGPFDVNEMSCVDTIPDLTEEELTHIYTANREYRPYAYMLARKEFLHLYRTVRIFFERLRQSYEMIRPILEPLHLNTDSIKESCIENKNVIKKNKNR
ncbi:hypothetical protein SNEBB_008484 [Seison nebaliae]|nr:hypothetical protein SNEBB_008484 [Seison nebaliae]